MDKTHGMTATIKYFEVFVLSLRNDHLQLSDGQWRIIDLDTLVRDNSTGRVEY